MLKAIQVGLFHAFSLYGFLAGEFISMINWLQFYDNEPVFVVVSETCCSVINYADFK